MKRAKSRVFLVYPISEKQLEDVIVDPGNVVLCAKSKENEIIGYVLAYDPGNWKLLKPSWEQEIKVSAEVEALLTNKNFLYIRHIARKKEYKGGRQFIIEKIAGTIPKHEI